MIIAFYYIFFHSAAFYYYFWLLIKFITIFQKFDFLKIDFTYECWNNHMRLLNAWNSGDKKIAQKKGSLQTPIKNSQPLA